MLTKCLIEGCYYKIDGKINPKDGSYYAKCQRCNKRTRFVDLTYDLRNKGEYTL